MAIDILLTTDKIEHDPVGRSFIDYIKNNSSNLGLDDAVLYYNFPTYADYETVRHKPDALIVSPKKGILAFKFFNDAMLPLSSQQIGDTDESLGQFCSILIGRLLKSKSLRKGLSILKFDVTPVILFYGGSGITSAVETSKVVSSLEGISKLLSEISQEMLGCQEFSEIRSVVEGAKALTRPQKRLIINPDNEKHAVALAKLEAEIANFDERQRRAALISVTGPRRIRGLAGSGKTVILAMKAAMLHLNNPEEKILITFYTKSLKTSIKNMISKFYRHYRDEDPDWRYIHVRHGWGGQGMKGVYSEACSRNGISSESFSQASRMYPNDPFGGICRDLCSKGIEPYYDHVLIDEGQDFPSGFYELCFFLAKGERDKKNIIWAYDELQNILNTKIRSPEELFGTDKDGKPRISLDRASKNLVSGMENDTVLSKCYRNQREVLVTAHALGFGIYNNIVQLLESAEHWNDVGYIVLQGEDFKVGEKIKIERPIENNPVSLTISEGDRIIDVKVAQTIDEEINWNVNEIKKFIKGGLQADDILVVALDDRNVRYYFKELSKKLAKEGVETNNILSNPYSEPAFQIQNKITLSTVYRAKGNEAAVVLAIGVDGVNAKTRSGRNKLFTAFTRSKAWLRVSGMGYDAKVIKKEIEQALGHFPNLEFTMPDLAKIEMIQRDLSERAIKAKRVRAELKKQLKEQGYSDEEIKEILTDNNNEEI